MNKRMTGVLKIFSEMKSDSLDLHTLFEAGGNDTEARKEIVDIVAHLACEGYLEGQGSDFYSLTEKGRRAIKKT